LLRSFQRIHSRLELADPSTESPPAVHPNPTISYPLSLIFLETPTIWPYRKDARRRTKKIPCRAASGNVAKRKRFHLVTTSVTKADEKFSKRENTMGEKNASKPGPRSLRPGEKFKT